MSVILGVIPFTHIEDDKIIYEYLLSIKDNPHVEIAQHGTYHTQSEIFNLTEDETYKLAKIGKDKLYDLLKINPVTFIPPNNEYNDNSTFPLSELGFKYLSAGNQYWDNLYDTRMYRVGYSTATKYGNNGAITPDTQVISDCKESLDATNFCLVLFHPQDYDNRGLDSFKNILDGLLKLNATTKTFGSK
ncbi:MAG: DUF2334 domain-containing protein [Candidatus Methanoperedens sp.]|nr:DUF2334 domain-containing protein [Candidatus Methanoperedens sp.]